MKALLLATVAALSIGSAYAKDVTPAWNLPGVATPEDIKPWTTIAFDFYGKCRGGSGDDPRTQVWCDAESAIGNQIKKMGWCYDGHTKLGWNVCDNSHLTTDQMARVLGYVKTVPDQSVEIRTCRQLIDFVEHGNNAQVEVYDPKLAEDFTSILTSHAGIAQAELWAAGVDRCDAEPDLSARQAFRKEAASLAAVHFTMGLLNQMNEPVPHKR